MWLSWLETNIRRCSMICKSFIYTTCYSFSPCMEHIVVHIRVPYSRRIVFRPVLYMPNLHFAVENFDRNTAQNNVTEVAHKMMLRVHPIFGKLYQQSFSMLFLRCWHTKSSWFFRRERWPFSTFLRPVIGRLSTFWCPRTTLWSLPGRYITPTGFLKISSEQAKNVGLTQMGVSAGYVTKITRSLPKCRLVFSTILLPIFHFYVLSATKYIFKDYWKNCSKKDDKKIMHS